MQTHHYRGFDVVQRYDNSWAIYAYMWWPDPYLDASPSANHRWLRATKGWRVKGWIIVGVKDSLAAAKSFIHHNTETP